MDLLHELFHNDNIPNAINAVFELAQPLEILEERGELPVRNENYFEITIPRYSDLQFREHFRMSRETFEELIIHIGHNRRNQEDRIIPLQKKIMFTIWVLSKPESFLAASDRFGLAKSSAHKIFCEILDLIGLISGQYIRWPNMQKLLQTANIFEARSRGIPGVIGAIDGCHIAIKQPENNPVDYYNRKGFHSIILQGVCDERGVFIDTTIGRPGRMHDARVFRLSEIYNRLIDENPIVPQNLHLIGDSAYPLMVNLMKPYQDNGHLTLEKVTYNIKLCSIRSIIERAFGLLKCKFRRLKYLDVKNNQIANRIILASCVLHNFIILQENPMDDYNVERGNIEINEENIDGNNQDILGNAEVKRANIVRLCSERN